MHIIFDQLINSFIADKVGITENFLTESLAFHLKENLTKCYSTQQLHQAGIGNAVLAVQDKLVRSDMIFWLDRKHNDQYENEFFELMDQFISHLNSSCYAGITGYEFHYTLYEKGSFYKKHIDRFRNNDSRQYSMIMYLNEGWQNGDGGELNIHHIDHQQKIAPINNKTVFFKSDEIEHEVLVTNKTRMSITGWLKIN